MKTNTVRFATRGISITSFSSAAFFIASFSIVSTIVMSAVWAERSHAAAFLADVTLSPVKTVLEIAVSPTATSIAGTLATADRTADRKEIMNAVASDAADHLSGEEPTPLLKEVHSLLRNELAHRGDAKAYSDQDLSRMIAAEFSVN